MYRLNALQQAEKAVVDREGLHGSAKSVIMRTAEMWSEYMNKEVEMADVCAMMILLKISRAKSRPNNADHWIDIAGYAAMGAEMADAKFIVTESDGGQAGAEENDPVLDRFPSDAGCGCTNGDVCENDCMMDDE